MHADVEELEHALGALERDIRHALEHDCDHGGDQRPASITLTVQ